MARASRAKLRTMSSNCQVLANFTGSQHFSLQRSSGRPPRASTQSGDQHSQGWTHFRLLVKRKQLHESAQTRQRLLGKASAARLAELHGRWPATASCGHKPLYHCAHGGEPALPRSRQ